MIGKKLDHYEVFDLLGRGGMGEVYRARDTKLDREVAIKVLPTEVARDPERTARFAREARVLAQINHPNVAHIHGFEEVGDLRFLVMELVEGEDLAARLRRGAIGVDEALDLARQIADGLQEAHARGVVHRDLKPANVKVTPDGTAKILDFGLAANRPGVDDTADTQLSPTITAALTQAGTLLGTAAYMSPEQAAGRVCDQRADVWAWGVLVFEMLSGTRLFGEDSPSETLAAVIRAEPDWDILPANMPPRLRTVLEGCLRKKPRERWHAIADVRLMLDDLELPTAVSSTSRSPLRPHPVWILIALVGLGIGWSIPRGSKVDTSASRGAQTVVRSAIELPADTQLAGWASPTVAISPDGTVVAFVATTDGHQRLFVRRLSDAEAIEIPDSEGAEGPFFSPDGRWVGFGAGSISGASTQPPRLKKHDLSNGVTTDVCELGDYFGAAWATDGTIYFSNIQPRGLWKVGADGGDPQRVGPDDPERRQQFVWPQRLPGGDRMLVTSWTGPEVGRPMVVDLATGEATDLGLTGAFARWSTSGHLLVADRERRVVAYRFDPHDATLAEGSVPVLDEVTLSGNLAAVFALSESGDIVYSTGPVDGSRSDLARMFWLTTDGTVERVAIEEDFFNSVDVSPDGNRLAVCVESLDLWVHDLVRGTRLRLPLGETIYRSYPLWTPSGDQIAFTGVGANGNSNLFLQSADGVRPPRRLEARTGEFFPRSWEPGSRTLLFNGYLSDEADRVIPRIYRMDLDAPESIETLGLGESGLSQPHLSPDGRWLAYRARDTGRNEIFLRSYPDLQRKIPVGPGLLIEWSATGDRLFVARREAGSIIGIWEAAFDSRTGNTSPLRQVLDFTAIDDQEFDPHGALWWTYDAVNDRHLVLQGIPGAGEIRSLKLVQGWTREVSGLLPNPAVALPGR